jgi:hypothetical protein
MILADIKFRDGATHRCRGRAVNRVGVPWVDEKDLEKHIASIEGLEIVQIIKEIDNVPS